MKSLQLTKLANFNNGTSMQNYVPAKYNLEDIDSRGSLISKPPTIWWKGSL